MIALLLLAAIAQDSVPAPIEDNSFFLEEAYNQEPGVVQHINTMLHPGRRQWLYGFTQEWPVAGQRHQLSYTIAVNQGVDELALNYRMQVAGVGGGRLALAPRVSLIAPTGAGSEVQFNLPASVTLNRFLVTHWNAGATLARQSQATYHAGASAILLLRPTINLLVEVLWEGTAERGDVVVNPGIRWAHNVGSLQIVPGISTPDGRDLFFYVSFEHPF